MQDNEMKHFFKKGFLIEAKNYRPISQLTLISQLIESSVHNQTELSSKK